MTTVLGTTIDNDLLSLGDSERTSGLYILGKPRVGKSWLIVNLILQDIENGHGVFFLDPHGDAINDLISHLSFSDMQKPILLLDPENSDSVFGINPLECSDSEDARLRSDAYIKTKGVFDKLWLNTFEERPWLQLILQNTIYTFIENQGYTLADLPLFFHDPAFRAFLVGNMRYNRQVYDYWTKTFASKNQRDQDMQMEAAQTRAEIMLAHPYVRDIIGQSKSTLDFRKLIAEKKIILLKLSSSLSTESKKIIGTIIISELLTAARKRAEDRSQFCIFVDEFQNYASFEDFSTLITQAPKYGIATTIAHHERYGQLNQDAGIIGATSAIANKVLFQITPRDADELAPEFADKPPTEVKLEEQFAVSQNPVSDLLRGHCDPDIRRFVTKYLRFLEDKREDIKVDMEGVKFARMIELDTAAIYGAEAQEEGIAGPSHYANQVGYIVSRQNALLRARTHSINLVALHKQSDRLRVTMRELNRFLTEIMEGGKRAGQEAFSDFLISLASGYPELPESSAEVLDLYIKLSYGDPGKGRTIPFDLARSQGLFSKEVIALTFQAEKKTEEERRAFQARFIPEEEQNRARSRMWKRESKAGDRLRAMEGKINRSRYGDIKGGMTGRNFFDDIRDRDFIWNPPNTYTWFMWLSLFPDIDRLLIPYRTARFDETWQGLLADGQAARTIAKIDESLNLLKTLKPWQFSGRTYLTYMKARVARDLSKFLNRYQEGALVVLSLLDCAGKGGWRDSASSDISLTEFPGIEGKDPVEIWCLVERLGDMMRGALGEGKFSSLFIKYLVRESGYSYDELDKELYWAEFQTSVEGSPINSRIRYRNDVQSLETLLTERWAWFVKHHSAAGERWSKISAPVRYYLLCRAADLISFGEKHSSLPRSTFTPYEEVVSALVSLSKDTKARLDEAEEKEEAARERQRIEKECTEKVGRIAYSPPAILEQRVLDSAQIGTIRNACIEEIKQGPQVVYEVAATIDEFAKFCTLLSQPENHIKIRTGQYIEKEVPGRTEIDMVNQVVRELTGLEKYTAYTKVLRWTGKIRTLKLKEITGLCLLTPSMKLACIEYKSGGYLRERAEIDAEISARQEGWKTVDSGEPLTTDAEGERAKAQSSGVVGAGMGMPPPQFFDSIEDAPPAAAEIVDEPEPEGPVLLEEQSEEEIAVVEAKGIELEDTETKRKAHKYRLVYKSDFYKPPGWDEDVTDKAMVFRKNGYYHIRILKPDYYAFVHHTVVMNDFVAQVDCEFVKRKDFSPRCSCGIVFSITGGDTYCVFRVSGDGSFSVTSCRNGAHDRITEWQDSKYIKQGNKANTLLIAKKGLDVTLWVNGHDVASVSDYHFTSGMVGIFVGNGLVNPEVEGRFINFELSSIE